MKKGRQMQRRHSGGHTVRDASGQIVFWVDSPPLAGGTVVCWQERSTEDFGGGLALVDRSVHEECPDSEAAQRLVGELMQLHMESPMLLNNAGDVADFRGIA